MSFLWTVFQLCLLKAKFHMLSRLLNRPFLFVVNEFTYSLCNRIPWVWSCPTYSAKPPSRMIPIASLKDPYNWGSSKIFSLWKIQLGSYSILKMKKIHFWLTRWCIFRNCGVHLLAMLWLPRLHYVIFSMHLCSCRP